MAQVVNIPVTITEQGSEIDINIPPVTRIVHRMGVDTTIEWTLHGTPGWKFTNTNFHNWKSGSGQPAVSRTSDVKLTSASYPPPENGARWSYGVRITNDTLTLKVDPEVDNLPPIPDM